MKFIKNLFGKSSEPDLSNTLLAPGTPAPVEPKPLVSKQLLASTSKAWPPTLENSTRPRPTTVAATTVPVPTTPESPEKDPSVTTSTDTADNASPTVPANLTEALAHFRREVFSKPSPLIEAITIAERLREFLPDGDSRLKAAAAVLGDRVTAADLNAAIDGHLKELDTEHAKVIEQVEKQRELEIAALKRKAEDFIAANNTIDVTLKSLQSSIDRMTAEREVNRVASEKLLKEIESVKSTTPHVIDEAVDKIKADLNVKRESLVGRQ